MAKGAMPEHLPTFGGHYVGAVSTPSVKNAIERSDCILFLGNYPVSDIPRAVLPCSVLTAYSVIPIREPSNNNYWWYTFLTKQQR